LEDEGIYARREKAQTAFLALDMDTSIKNSMLRVNFYDPMHPTLDL
jgi:hypothetical protein